MPFFEKKDYVTPRSRRLEKTTHKSGLRHYIFNTVGDKYKGEWLENKKSGQGNLTTVTNDRYEGEFSSNYRHGFGVLSYRIKGTTNVQLLGYRGSWKNGWPEGYGIRVYRDGSYYLGEWKRGKRHGRGQMWYANKSWYEGDWVNDCKQGLGMFVRADGNRYEGAYYNDMKHGEGRFIFLKTGQIQDGVWRNDFCAFSVMYDIPFRQTAIKPSMYPIQVCCLIGREEVCRIQKQKVLSNIPKSCLSLISDDSVFDKLHPPTL